MSQQFITLTPIISDISGDTISTVSDNTIVGFVNENDNSIQTTAVFSTDIDREFSVTPVSIDSTIVFSTDTESEFLFTVGDVINVQSFGDINLDREIPEVTSISSTLNGPQVLYVRFSQTIELLSDKIDIVKNTQIQTVADEQIGDFEFDGGIASTAVVSLDTVAGLTLTTDSVTSTENFEQPQVNQNLNADAIDSTANFGISQLDRDLIANSIEPTTQFSENVFFDYLIGQLNLLTIEPTTTFGEPSLNSFIVPIAIESTEIVPNLTAFVSIGPDSIPSGLNFGQPTFNNPVHRSLIFKDDKITKLGTNDDVEVASGVVIKTSTAQLTGSSVPGSAAGYITVTINGTDFAMPFFNIDDV